MKQRPSIKDQNIGVFFGKSSKTIKKQNSRTVEPKISKKLQYQKKWTEEGRIQIALWIPYDLRKKLKIQAIREDKNFSQLATDIFTKALKGSK